MADTQQLLAGVRAKYPGAYDNTPDDVLLAGVKKKFPGAYDSYSLEPTQQSNSQEVPDSAGIWKQPLQMGMNVGKAIGKTYGAIKEPLIREGVKMAPGLQLLSQIPQIDLKVDNPVNTLVPSPLNEVTNKFLPKVNLGKTSGPQMANQLGGAAFDTMVGLGTEKAIAGIPGALSNRAENLALKARDTAVKLFPQAEGSLEDIRNTGTQVSKYLQKSKNYEDVANQLEMAKGINAGERQKLYDAGTLSESRIQHEPIMKLLNDARNSPSASTSQGRRLIKELEDIQTSDVDFLNSQPKESLNDPNFYQKMKSHYQNLAQKAGAYKTDPSQAVKSEAYRAMSEGYQNKTYNVNEAIQPINQEEAGLIKGTEYAKDLAKGEALDLKPSLAKEAISSISGSPRYTAARFVSKTWIDKAFGSQATRLTSKIERLTRKSESAQKVADLIGEFFSKSKPIASEQKLLPAPPQSLLGVNRRSEMSNYLPPGQSTGMPTINVEPTQIDLPETTHTQMQALAEKFGAGKNVRSSINAENIPQGVGKVTETPKAGGKPLSKKAKEILKRRGLL